MVQVIDRNPGFGYGFGKGVGDVLQSLAQNKLQQIQQRESSKTIRGAFPGLSENEANFLSQNPAILPAFIERMGGFGQQQTQQQAPLQQFASPEQLIEQNPAQQQAPAQRANIAQLLNNQPQQQSAFQQAALRGLTPAQQQQFAAQQSPSALERTLQRPIQLNQPELQPQQGQKQLAPLIQTQLGAPVAQAQPKNLAEVLAQPSKTERVALRREQLAREKEEEKKRVGLRREQVLAQKEVDKETKPFYEQTIAKKDAADFADTRLNKMENLIKKGNLPRSGFYSALKNIEEHALAGPIAGATIGAQLGGPYGAAIGGLIGAFASPIASIARAAQRSYSADAEEFEKLSNDFVKDAKAIFGSRITDADLRAFMATVPTLSNTDQGKLAIIKNMRSFNDAAKIKYNNMKRIIKENYGKRPADLSILVEEKSKPQLDKLADKFVTG